MFYNVTAYIDAPDFELDLEAAANPAFRGKLLVISQGDPARGTVRCCSRTLRQQGVNPGARIPDVKRQFPGTLVAPERTAFREGMSRKVTAALVEKVPALEKGRQHSWFVDLTGCARLVRNDFMGWSQTIAGFFRDEFRLVVQVGVGSNKVMAEFAASLAEPGCAVHLYPWEEAELMGWASLDMLPGLSRREKTLLAEKRLHWAWELKALGEERLRQWFGSRDGSRVWDVIHGRCLDPIKPLRVPRMLKQSYTFPRGTANSQDVIQAGILLTGNLLYDVGKLNGVLHRVVGQISYSDDHTCQREVHVNEALDESDYYEAVERMLENALTRRVLVRELTLMAPVDFEPGEQSDLFSEKQRVKKLDLERALTAVRDKYGYRYLRPASGLVRSFEKKGINGHSR